MRKLADRFRVLFRYRYLLQQLVARDFKIKYKRSVLGVLWSIFNPLLTMLVLSIVFIQLLNMGGGIGNIPDYPVYLLSGLAFWNGFSEATNMALGSIIGNFNLITKVRIPKYIFPLSKVLSSAVNMLFSFVALYFIVLIEIIRGQTTFAWQNVFMPFDFICAVTFSFGIGLIVSALTVFFRDMLYLYGVFLTIWMYLTPIMYSMPQILKNRKWFTGYFSAAMQFNPMYHYINFAHTIIFGGTPTVMQFADCLLFAAGAVAVGLLFFQSKQKKFIYYI